jgi:hypothetical protein
LKEHTGQSATTMRIMTGRSSDPPCRPGGDETQIELAVLVRSLGLCCDAAAPSYTGPARAAAPAVGHCPAASWVVAPLGFSSRSKPGGVATRGGCDPNLSHQIKLVPHALLKRDGFRVG